MLLRLNNRRRGKSISKRYAQSHLFHAFVYVNLKLYTQQRILNVIFQAFISLSGNNDLTYLTSSVYEAATGTTTVLPNSQEVFAFSDKFKSKLSLYSTVRDIQILVDIAKVADILVFVIDASEPFDNYGETLASVLLAQGIPTTIGVLTGLEKIPAKNRNDAKKQAIKTFHRRFANAPRVLEYSKPEDAQQIVRFLCNEPLKTFWRDNRPHMLVQRYTFLPYEDPSCQNFGELKIEGYLRGTAMDPNCLVHLTDYGDFQISRVETVVDPNFKSRNESGMESVHLLGVPDPEKQETLQSEVEVEPLAGEQNFGNEDMILHSQSKIVKRKVPKGTSEYQASWILDEYDDDEYDEEDEENDHIEMNDDNRSDDGEPSSADELDLQDSDEDSFDREAQEDLEFPDEQDIDEREPARIRYQKYIGLKSFRTTPWDPKMNLPLSHSRIFQFRSFERAKKKILEDSKDYSIDPDQWVVIYVKDVHQDLLKDHHPNVPLLLSSQFPNENKISVVNYSVQKFIGYEKPIKSKEELIIHSGFKRFKAAPLFSENSANMDKHKYEKFLHGNRNSVATIYGPITYPPMPVLFWKASEDGIYLAATGTVLNIDPDRIVLKKIILTGHPKRATKKRVVVKNMFYDPDDVRWFKPVDVWTKRGARGQIEDAHGTRGLFKCAFNSFVNNQDVVCMSLYKRIFPLWPILPNPPRLQSGSQQLY